MQAGGAFIEYGQVSCARGLEGQPIAIDRLDGTLTDVLVRIQNADGSVRTARLTPSNPSFVVPEQPGPLMVLRAYVGLGIEHILFGIDHLLFVLCLLLLVRGIRNLLATITAFTLAHSITLAAATLGFIRVPAAPVEATIALSIVFLASELVRGEGARRRGAILSMAGSVQLRPAAWAGLCRRAGRGWSAARRDSAGAVCLQCRRGIGAARLRHRGLVAGASCPSPAATPAGLGAGCGRICDRVGRRILGVRPTCGCGLMSIVVRELDCRNNPHPTRANHLIIKRPG